MYIRSNKEKLYMKYQIWIKKRRHFLLKSNCEVGIFLHDDGGGSGVIWSVF
jgi:hypothetical protein